MKRKLFRFRAIWPLISLAVVAPSLILLPIASAEPEGAKKESPSKYIKQAESCYQEADFYRALLYYEKALELDKSNIDVQNKIEKCKEMRRAKQALLLQLPRDPKERDKVLKAKFNGAKDMYKKSNLATAGEEFKNIWLVNGDKKARKYMELIEKKLSQEEKEKSEVAQVEKEEAARKEAEQKEKLIKQHIKQGKKLAKKEQYEEALAEFNRVFLLDPNNPEAKREIEKTKKIMKEKEEVLAEKAREEKIESLITDAKKLYREDEFERTIVLCDEVLEIDPQNKSAKSLREKAKSKMDKEQANAKEASTKELIEKHTTQWIKFYEEEKFLEAKKEFMAVFQLDRANRQATRYLEEINQVLKEKAEEEKVKETKVATLLSQGEALLGEKKFEAAIDKFDQVLKINRTHERALELISQAKAGLEAEKRAEEVAEKEEKEKIESEKIEKEMLEKAEALTEEGIKLYQKERYDEALAKFSEALEIEPLYARALEYRKRTEDKIREIAQKRAAEEKARSLLEEARRLHSEKLYDQALAKVKEAEEAYPGLKGLAQLKKDITKVVAEEKQAEVDQLLRQANDLYRQGKYEDALVKYQQAQKLQPENTKIARYIARCTKAMEEEKKAQTQKVARERREKAQQLFDEGLEAYKKQDLGLAVEKWQAALNLNPDHMQARTYLEETKEEYEKLVAARLKKEEFERREAEAKKKMETLVSIATKPGEPTPLGSFLSLLSLTTDINFSIVPGVEATVQGRFEDKPLKEILDTILIPIGLKWSRAPASDVVVISPDLHTKVFNLTPIEAGKAKALMEREVIQKLLWGPAAKPSVEGVEITLDERELILILRDSQKHIDTLSSFLQDLKLEAPPELVYRSYQVPAAEAEKIRTLLEAMLGVKKREAYTPEEWAQVAPYERQRKIMVSESELIIYDTPENLARAEEILKDKGFIGKITGEELKIRTLDIAPKQALQQDPEELKRFALRIKDIIETKLYAQEGRKKAEQEGRKLWLDPYAMQITIVDYPNNIRDVEEFIQSLPQVERKERSEIVFLKHASASQMVDKLQTILGIAPAEVPGVARGITATHSLRVEGEFEFRDLHIRLLRVNENDVNDEHDDSAEFIVRTPTTSQEVTIEEYHSEFIDQYEIVADDIRPSGTPGEGRVRVTVRFIPPTTQVMPTPTEEAVVTEAERREEEVGISIDVIEDLNAILIRYTDPTRYAEVMDWIEELDIPVKQVSIESKFVEVMESRAKEISSEFTILDLRETLTEGVAYDQSWLNMRFAKHYDEFRDALEPPIETPGAANLLKGTTILDWIIFGGESPINLQLRLLEAEGVINVVSGPHVTVVNGESAEFVISKEWRIGWFPAEAPLIFDQVDLEVTPTITQMDHITLEIDAVIEDFDADIGDMTAILPAIPAPGQEWWTVKERPGGLLPFSGPQAVYNTFGHRAILRKDITTIARIKNGQTIVLGGWMGERAGRHSSGVPILRNLPYVGKVLFSRNLDTMEKTTLLIFLTGTIVE